MELLSGVFGKKKTLYVKPDISPEDSPSSSIFHTDGPSELII